MFEGKTKAAGEEIKVDESSAEVGEGIERETKEQIPATWNAEKWERCAYLYQIAIN